MRIRWLFTLPMVGLGVIAASWGAFDVAQIGECGGDGAPACPVGAVVPILALVAGLSAAIFGTVISRSGRLFYALFGFVLTGGAMAVWLSLYGPGAEVGVAPPPSSLKLMIGSLGGLGLLILLVAMKPRAPRVSARSSWGGSGGDWGDSGSWGDSGGDSGCSSGCGGGCGGGGD